jgi:methyl-accepting chemotaxis protein
MEEMSASVRNNANSAIQVTSVAQETLQQAENGRNVVSRAVSAMNQIETSAKRITEIVSVIDSIASQTNLLALNAAVEAARAGEAGKGFAVVASEVRTLASRCSEAARDIRGLITGSNAQVVDGVKLVNATGTALKEIVESITNVTTTIASISQACREQATGVEEISSAISQMDEITQQNAGLADNSAANARELAKEAETLANLVQSFKTNDDSTVLGAINKKLSKERDESSSIPVSKKNKLELSDFSNDKFSDFGTAMGDDWADL